MKTRTIYTENGVKRGGRLITRAKSIKEISKEYTRTGWVYHMEAQICGATIRFTLTEKERNNPELFMARELGPEAAFDDKDSAILLDAIREMSDPAFVLKLVEGYTTEADGMWRDGKQLTDFGILSVRKVNTDSSAGASVSGIESIGKENRYFDLETVRAGVSKTIRLTRAELMNGLASNKIGGNVADNIQFHMMVQDLADEAA